MPKQPQNIIITKVALDVLTELTDVQAGQLFKAIRLYQIAAYLHQECVTVETIQSKTSWQDDNQDVCLKELQGLLRNSYVRLAFTACKTQIDEQIDKTFSKTAPKAPTRTKEQAEEELKQRQQAFYQSLIPFLKLYDKVMLRAFYNYWSQPNKSGTKMGWELEKTWDTEKRLVTWANREKGNKQATTRTTPGTETISTKTFETW